MTRIVVDFFTMTIPYWYSSVAIHLPFHGWLGKIWANIKQKYLAVCYSALLLP